MRKREQTEGSRGSGMLAGGFWEGRVPQPHKDFPAGCQMQALPWHCVFVSVCLCESDENVKGVFGFV